jgi:hypothetical protein
MVGEVMAPLPRVFRGIIPAHHDLAVWGTGAGMEDALIARAEVVGFVVEQVGECRFELMPLVRCDEYDHYGDADTLLGVVHGAYWYTVEESAQ